MSTREDLEKEAEGVAKSELFEEYLETVLEMASFEYHQVTLNDYLNDELQELSYQLRQQMGIDLDTYKRVMGVDDDEIRQQRMPHATAAMKRQLVLQKFIQLEGLTITEEEFENEITNMVSDFGDQAELYRPLFDNPQTRQNLAQKILSDKLVQRVVEIAQGEAPALDDAAEEHESTETVENE
jgi:trigger factor